MKGTICCQISGIVFQITESNVLRLIRLQQESAASIWSSFGPSPDHNLTFDSYRTLDEFQAYFQYQEETRPDLVSVEEIGQSYEG